MDSHERARSGAGKVLLIVFILFAFGMIGVLAKNILQRVDGDTITITPEAAAQEKEECGDEQAQQALKRAGVKVPVKCRSNNNNNNSEE